MTVLLSRWVITLVGTALLAGLVWVFGPLLPQLQDMAIRAAVIVVMLLVWAVMNLLLDLRRRGRDTALTKGLTSDSAEETAALRDKLATALDSLKQVRKSRGYLYEQPWYAIIGPPGAGKTTALLNAGLKFPLAEAMGQGALTGVGGTRLCEWWFTDDAVLIDTAGRYTTQDSDAAVDRAGWDAFLDLLKRTRPRQPLNGVIVAIALSDVAQAPPTERAAHARAIRARIKELQTRLGVRMPVYAMFTKADLIAGFTQFFDDLDDAGRAQVWGTTFPLKGEPATSFAAEFRALVERLHQRMFERLQAEPNADRRAQIALFPTQVASLEQPLIEFVQAAFGGTRADPAPLLRGVYLTSGTQEGTPIDRLIGTMSRSFGLDQRRAPALRAGQGRSFFLARLLRDVMFGEAMLVAHNPRAAGRRATLRASGFALALLLVVAAGGWLFWVDTAGQRQIAAADAALGEYEQAAQKLPMDAVADADLPRLLPALDVAAALSQGLAEATPPWWMLGLSQQEKLAAAARAVYRNALQRALLPRLVWRQEALVRGFMNQPDALYEATRVYLMLGNAGPLDRDLVHQWMQIDWQSQYPNDTQAPIRTALLRHLDALLADPLPTVALDGGLVAQARAVFAGVPMAERAYSLIRNSAAARKLPPWRPSDALGPAGIGMFTRASGKDLSVGVDGFFTADGFHKLLLPSIASSAAVVVSESWVLGKRIEFEPDGPQMRRLQHEVVALYETDFARAWDAVLADINMLPMRSLPRAAQDLYMLASPESPMRKLLVSMAHNLRLSVPPGGAAAKPAPEAAVTPAADTAAQRLQAVLGKAQAAETGPSAPGQEIDARYAALLTLVGDGPGAPIDQVLRSLTDIQQQTAKLAAAAVGTTAAPAAGADPVAALQAEAVTQPPPLSRWLTQIAQSAIALRGGTPKAQLSAEFHNARGPAAVCTAAVVNHYPFGHATDPDTAVADFAKLFAPGGMFDGFVNTMLRPYLDMTSSTLRLADGTPPAISPADLAQFQRAAQIRDLFFSNGGTSPALHLDITPSGLDKTSRQATLDLGGTVVTDTHEASHTAQPVAWPGPTAARLTFDPPAKAGALQESGPWAMFRLFAHARLQPGASADRFTLTFQLGDREAAFDVHASAAANPLAPALLQDFHCPDVSGT